MNPDRWRRLESLFQAASNLQGTQRAVYLDQNCADDLTLRRQVETLIDSSEEVEDGGTLIGEAVRDAASSVLSFTTTTDGQRLGPYQIIRQLGSGGMGNIFLAERADDQYRTQVAIKVVRDTFPGAELLERFRAERQILADLNHPNIARLIDGGVTASGLPYLVMEYIDGVPIDEYCEQHQLSVAERLQLFRTVCLAVQHSHSSLIVHRDIKPNNILVTSDGVPKLLDFGIAKPLRPLGNSPENLTRTLQRLMTPEYASPEQVRGDRITTATDIYSLGVLLYELLCGRPPLRLRGAGPLEVVRIVCEEQPERPSSRIAQADAGKTGPQPMGVVARDVPRDLDDVVLMALDKDPARRYGSASELADDIENLLNNSPVRAHPEGPRDRFQRFVRRHRLGAVTAVIFALIVAGFLTGLFMLARRAQNEAKTSQHTTDFLISLFQSNDPAAGRGDLVTAREVLNRGAKRLETELKDEPAVQVRLLDSIGTIFITLGDYKGARAVLDRSMEIRRRLFQDDIGGMAETLAGLGYLTVELSQFKESEAYYRESLALCRRKYGEMDDNVAAVLSNLSSVLWEQGKYPEAVDLDKQAVAIRTRLLGRENRDTLSVMHNLASVLLSQGDYAAAEAQAREVLAIRLRTLGPKHSDLGFSWSILAHILDSQGKFVEAEKAARESLAVRTEAYQEGNPQIAVAQYNLSRILCHTGKYDEALALARRALELDLKTFGPNHRDTAFAESSMALALFVTGNLKEARAHQQASLDGRIAILPAGHPGIAEALARRISIDLALHDISAAGDAMEKALPIQRRIFGNGHLIPAASETLLAEVRIAQNRLAEAKPLALHALQTAQKALPANHPDIAAAQSALGWIAHLEHNDAEASALLNTASQSFAASYGPKHPDAIAAKARLASISR